MRLNTDDMLDAEIYVPKNRKMLSSLVLSTILGLIMGMVGVSFCSCGTEDLKEYAGIIKLDLTVTDACEDGEGIQTVIYYNNKPIMTSRFVEDGETYHLPVTCNYGDSFCVGTETESGKEYGFGISDSTDTCNSCCIICGLAESPDWLIPCQ